MNFLELSKQRKSVRKYTEQDIPQETVTKMLEAMIAAPSAGNCQPWHIYVIRNKEIQQKMCDVSWNQKFIVTAPVCIVVCIEYARTISRYGERGRDLYSIQDTAAAIQNMLLFAEDVGLGACWIGAFDEKVVGEILALPEGRRAIGIIPVGYPDGTSGRTSRRPIEEVCTFINEN